MYELGHMIRKPSKDVCIFLAPTVPLVRQQAIVIENSTDFKVRSYYGNRKNLKSHDDWEKELEQTEVLVMTPQILLHNLQHCFIRMELVALLIFDECHHAQAQRRHSYAQIMKEFYRTITGRGPRIFGMTASPIIGKGGSNQLNYTKCINSLENLLDAKICSIDESIELENIVASPDVKVYFYGPNAKTASGFNEKYCKKLEEIKIRCISMAREKVVDLKALKKKIKLLFRVHDNLIFCLEQIGLQGAIQAARTFLSDEVSDLKEIDAKSNCKDNWLADLYLKDAVSVLNLDLLNDESGLDSFPLEALEEPFFSKKLSLLIQILYKYREKTNIKCIVFVKRIIVAKSLAYILGNIEALKFWRCQFLVGFHSGSVSRRTMNTIVEKFCTGEVNLLVATNVAEEGLDIQTCCLVLRFDLPETVASFIQSRGRARMLKSEYVFLVERGNQHEERLLEDFMFGEKIMNKEVTCRTSNETFDNLEETTYRVDATGASISTGCSVSLLHHYCSKLPHDQYFTPVPKFSFKDDLSGTICSIILPSNCPIRQVESQPSTSKGDARRAACLKACMKLHVQGALTEYLLPGISSKKQQSGAEHAESDCNEDELLREELHESLVPAALRAPWKNFEDKLNFHFYYMKFVPVPEDREYRRFGLFVTAPLPEEAKTMEVDLHLAHGRIVKAGLVPSGILMFDKEEIVLAQKFQEMFLKIVLDRSEFWSDFVPLGMVDISKQSLCTYYLLLPVMEDLCGNTIDWTTVGRCLSSPVFRQPTDADGRGYPQSCSYGMLELADGPVEKRDLISSLVFTPHNKTFFFVADILYETSAYSQMKGSKSSSYFKHYQKRFKIHLLHPKQPFLKAKQLFHARNLLHNRIQESTEARELEEYFVELPPEVCCLKITGFSKDIGSSLSLLPSFMHRLENLLVAIELKDLFAASFPEGIEISAYRVLEALTTEKCLERFSLERLEVLGDAFLKYAVGRHSFLSYGALDEGQLTMKRSSIVNNSHLYELATRKNLQVYIRDELFDPSHFFAFGRPCKTICNEDTESVVHCRAAGAETSNVKCNKSHCWLHRKTIADAVEALTGAFLVDSGFRAASAFLQWLGIEVSFDISNAYRICEESKKNMSLIANVEIPALEKLLGYRFQHRGVLIEAFVHPSYNKHSGGCYQRLEFLGDAVLEYLITSYLYSVYPDLKPGQLTDLRSITVNNVSFAHIAVSLSFHKYLIKDSNSLTEAIEKFERYVYAPESEKDLIEELSCPKVLGDIVESCIGAILLDSRFDLKQVWRTMLTLLGPVLRFSCLQLNPLRELLELCQSSDFKLSLPDPQKVKEGYAVEVIVTTKERLLTCTSVNLNSKVARKMAAQEAISKLKEMGFEHKRKNLEIVRSTRRQEPKLIGFDENSELTDALDTAPLEVLEQHEAEGPNGSGPFPNESSDASFDSSGDSGKPVLLKRSSLPSNSANAHKDKIWKPVKGQKGQEKSGEQIAGTDVISDCSSNEETTGLVGTKPAKSKLLEVCAANFWKPPSFVCCKEEGESHLKMFTYKVMLEVEAASSTIIECFSEPKLRKRAAQDHAAEGALWCLKHMGF
uniref:Endoribonuclease Dicer 4 n=4 Tax=Anthurium amnicola TaxID=1678845 RepID=A0A1D1YWK0_9ARAE